jgi:hypothetical protein
MSDGVVTQAQYEDALRWREFTDRMLAELDAVRRAKAYEAAFSLRHAALDDGETETDPAEEALSAASELNRQMSVLSDAFRPYGAIIARYHKQERRLAEERAERRRLALKKRQSQPVCVRNETADVDLPLPVVTVIGDCETPTRMLVCEVENIAHATMQWEPWFRRVRYANRRYEGFHRMREAL